MDQVKKFKNPGNLFSFVWDTVFLYFIRPSLKWLLHVTTGKSEIERIYEYYRNDKKRAFYVESSIKRSKHPQLKQLLDSCPVESTNSAVALIMKVKYINKKQQSLISVFLQADLRCILGYYQLKREVERLRKIKYDSSNEDHEEMLIRLWNLMKPDEVLPDRITENWNKIGFQGKDPSTDFRGMGVLGLQQLVYFCEYGSDFASSPSSRVYNLSLHPRIGYPFAIAGIGFTSMVRELLHDDYLKYSIFTQLQQFNPRSNNLIDIFHDLYCSVFVLFCDAWIKANPESIMDFNTVKEAFKDDLIIALINEDIVLPTYNEAITIDQT